jgi:hypothetical protein
MTMQRLLPALALATLACSVQAKLPAPDPAAKAKADETAAKAAWQAKVDSYQLCKVQDKIASKFGQKGQGAKGPAAAAVKTAAPATAASAAKPAAPAAAAASAPASAAATGDKPTPVSTAGAPPTPCADPGPFAYNPPQQTPLETSGAHSPAGNAASPPSVRPESATMVPGKK